MKLALTMLGFCGLIAVGGCTSEEPTVPSYEVTDAAATENDLNEPDTEANSTYLKLSSNDVQLAFNPEIGLTLSLNETTLLTLAPTAFSIGLVDTIDPDLNYDPSYLEPGQFGDFLYEAPKGLRWILPTGFSKPSTENDALRVELDYEEDGRAEVVAKIDGEGRFVLRWKPLSLSAKGVMFRLAPKCSPKDGFYGLGEYFDQVEHRGKVRTMHFVPAELESGHNEAHVPIPLLLGTGGWGLFVESLRPMAFALATEEADRFRTTVGLREAGDEGLKFYLFAEAHPLDLTHHYYEVTGYPGAISRTALGPWIWRDEVSDQAQVETDFQTIRELDLATTGYWIDRPYATDVNSFDFNAATYPSPSQMMAQAGAKGLDMALWHTPYLDPDGTLSSGLYTEAEANGYFPPIQSPLLAKWGPPLDFSNPAAYAWWQQQLTYYQELGIRGYKLDYAQEVVVGGFGSRFPWSFADGSNELTMHRDYQRLYHRVYRDMLPEAGGFLLVRSGTYGDQTHGTIIWPGDIDATMSQHGATVERPDGTTYISVGGLPAAIIAGSSLGPSGFPYFASDTGGYRNAPPSKETFIRWFQHTAFSPVMQVGTNTNDLPWAFGKDAVLDEEILSLYRTYARLHLRLFPYLWTYSQRIAEDGRPIQRPLGLAYPELEEHPSDIYLLGENLLVAPVIEEGAVSREVLLPPGTWVDFFTGESHPGGQKVFIESPLSKIPVLVKAGALLPTLRPTIASMLTATGGLFVDAMDDDADPLWVLTTPGEDSKFVLYDGTTLRQESTEASIVFERSKGSEFDGDLVLEITAFGDVPSRISIDGLDVAEAVAVGALKPMSWTWSPDKNGTLRIHLGSEKSTIQIER